MTVPHFLELVAAFLHPLPGSHQASLSPFFLILLLLFLIILNIPVLIFLYKIAILPLYAPFYPNNPLNHQHASTTVSFHLY